MVTLNDIAKAAGVSRGTVDRVLHHRGKVAVDKEADILQIAKQLGYKPNEVGRGLAVRKKHLKIGFIYVDNDVAPFQQYIYLGATQYAEELKQYGVEVEFLPLSDDKKPEANQKVRVLEQLIGDKTYDGFVVMGTIADGLQTAITEMGGGQLPIIVFYMAEEADWVLSSVACDFRQAGKLAMGMAAIMTRDHGKILAVTVDFNDLPSVYERVAGFEEELQNHPGMQIVEHKVFNGNRIDSSFCDEVEQCFQYYGDVDIIWIVNPGDHDAIARLFYLADKYHAGIITNDLVSNADRKLLRYTPNAVSINHDPYEQGKIALDQMFQYLAFGKLPDSGWLRSKLEIKTAYNVD